MAKRASDPTQFAVCLKRNRYVNRTSFADIATNQTTIPSVGWHFNQRFEHQGYASESVAALFDYLFKVKGARRLYAWVEDYNYPLKNYASDYLCDVKDVLKNLSPLKTRRVRQGMTTHTSMRYCIKNGRSRGRRKMSAPRSWRTFGSVNSSRRARSGSRLLPGISIYGKQISQARDIYY
ncbi:GNAT family N-acetyltransferase [Klebsiella pneumoniae]|uniref:GNAT family N-acetyltransferase n=1 Tax=Klebsiella pneumoniae TaxID=573 RepID=UPI001D0E4599|nr:GNAT family N-acetyltransferase [Klebsiella pneumoniae]